MESDQTTLKINSRLLMRREIKTNKSQQMKFIEKKRNIKTYRLSNNRTKTLKLTPSKSSMEALPQRTKRRKRRAKRERNQRKNRGLRSRKRRKSYQQEHREHRWPPNKWDRLNQKNLKKLISLSSSSHRLIGWTLSPLTLVKSILMSRCVSTLMTTVSL